MSTASSTGFCASNRNTSCIVASEIVDNKVEAELCILCSLHGIGVILLNTENPSKNADFKDFIDLVGNYYETGRVRKKDWLKA